MKIWKEGHMKIGIKDEHEIKLMRESGRILGLILHELGKNILPGMTGLELDAMAEKMMKDYGVVPSFKGYKGFPNVTCINVNDQVVHGIPTRKPFQEGDKVTIDCGVIYQKFHSDSAITKGVGNIDLELSKFIQTAEKARRSAGSKLPRYQSRSHFTARNDHRHRTNFHHGKQRSKNAQRRMDDRHT